MTLVKIVALNGDVYLVNPEHCVAISRVVTDKYVLNFSGGLILHVNTANALLLHRKITYASEVEQLKTFAELEGASLG